MDNKHNDRSILIKRLQDDDKNSQFIFSIKQDCNVML